MNTANDYGLLIIDIQGKLANLVDDSEVVLAKTVKLIKSCQLLSMPIVVLEQNPQGLGETAPELQQALNIYQPLEKYCFNGLAETSIQQQIESLNKGHWLVAGIEAHICVYQTVQGLLSEKYKVEVVTDCISSRKKANVELAINNMKQLGAKMTSLEMSIYQIMQTSNAVEFKQVLKVIK